tara:strand:- start:59 stop:439 length:381 start_codon:yes stop_codon:yes gene_type:complete
MNAQPATHFDALAILNGDAPIYVREAYDNLSHLVSDADADYVILRNSFEEGTDAQVVTFGDLWSLGRLKEIREEMQSQWGGEFDCWAVTVTAEVLPYFGRCLVLAFVGTHPDHPSLTRIRDCLQMS